MNRATKRSAAGRYLRLKVASNEAVQKLEPMLPDEEADECLVGICSSVVCFNNIVVWENGEGGNRKKSWEPLFFFEAAGLG